MWNLDILSLPDDVPAEQRYALSEDILAMEVVPSATGEWGLGPVSKLPEGAEVEWCGQGFNDRTTKVRWRGKVYFVFLADLETQRKPEVRCACC